MSAERNGPADQPGPWSPDRCPICDRPRQGGGECERCSPADQSASGVNADGEQWSIARYGTTVVVTLDGESDDIEAANEIDAAAEFAHTLFALWNEGNDEVPLSTRVDFGTTAQGDPWSISQHESTVTMRVGDEFRGFSYHSEALAATGYAEHLLALVDQGSRIVDSWSQA